MDQVNRKTGMILKRFTARFNTLADQLEDKNFQREARNVARAASMLERAATSYERKAARLAKLRGLPMPSGVQDEVDLTKPTKATVIKVKRRRKVVRQTGTRH